MWSTYPFGRILIPFGAGIWLYSVSACETQYALIALGLGILISYILFANNLIKKRQIYVGGICWVFLVLGAARGEQATNHHQHTSITSSSSNSWIGIIQSQITTTEKYFKCDVTCLNSYPSSTKWMLYLPHNGLNSPQLLDTVLFSGTPAPIKNTGNPFEFDKEKYYETKQVTHTLFANSWDIINSPSEQKYISVRSWFKSFVWKGISPLGEANRSVVFAMLTGDKQLLPKETRHQFTTSGIVHVLAVSGMHIGLIAAIPMLFLKRRKKRTVFRSFVVSSAIVLIWVYAFLVGGSPSVIRSSIMFSLFLIADHQRKNSHTINLLCASAVCILLIWPASLFSLSFQLSHLAVLGIYLGVRRLSDWYLPRIKIFQPIIQMAYVSISAQLATSPFILYHFNSFPTYFLIANLLIVPLLICVMYGALLSLITLSIPVVSTCCWYITNLLLEWSLWAIKQLVDLPYSTLQIPQFTWYHIIGGYLILALALKWKISNRIRTATKILSVWFVLMVIQLFPEKELVVFAGTQRPLLAIRDHTNITMIGDSSNIYSGIYDGYIQHHIQTKPHWHNWQLPLDVHNHQSMIQRITWQGYLIELNADKNNWSFVIDELNPPSDRQSQDTMIWNLDRNGAFSLKELELPKGALALHEYKLPIRVVHKQD